MSIPCRSAILVISVDTLSKCSELAPAPLCIGLQMPSLCPVFFKVVVWPSLCAPRPLVADSLGEDGSSVLTSLPLLIFYRYLPYRLLDLSCCYANHIFSSSSAHTIISMRMLSYITHSPQLDIVMFHRAYSLSPAWHCHVSSCYLHVTIILIAYSVTSSMRTSRTTGNSVSSHLVTSFDMKNVEYSSTLFPALHSNCHPG